MGDNLAFVTLRDAYGTTQLLFSSGAEAQHPASAALLAAAKQLKAESIVTVQGVVQARPASLVNPAMATGAVEVVVTDCAVLAVPAVPLPLLPGSTSGTAAAALTEDTRLQHRTLDLRRDVMQRNLRLRSAVTQAVRTCLHTTSPPFVEVETPTLFRSTPEGAREFLVPTRQSGAFYALPQSPQQHKQLLQVGGADRYFQIARCYRDEAGRADRQPEFTQIDLEMSFVTREDVMAVTEAVVRAAFVAVAPAAPSMAALRHYHPPLLHWAPLPDALPRMTFAHAMCVYGSDKPDRRLGLPLCDVTPVLATGGRDDAWPAAAAAVAWYKAGGHASYGIPAADTPVTAAWRPAPEHADLSTLLPTATTVRALVAPRLAAALSRKDMETLRSGIAKALGYHTASAGMPNLHVLTVEPTGSLKGSPLVKSMSGSAQAAVCAAAGAGPGDVLVLAAGRGALPCEALGTARLVLAEVCRRKGVALTPHGTSTRLQAGDGIAYAREALAAFDASTAATAAAAGAGAGAGVGGSHKKGAAAAVAAPASPSAKAGSKEQQQQEKEKELEAHQQGDKAVQLDMFWVTDFPLFELTDAAHTALMQGLDPFSAHAPAAASVADAGTASGDSSRSASASPSPLQSSHHPFTAPVPQDAELLAAHPTPCAALLGVRGAHYDLVCNGVELGGGSVRIAAAALQHTVLASILQVSPAQLAGFKHLLDALAYGAPPHAGIALGLDRVCQLLAGTAAASSVRDVIAFPKSATGRDLLTGAPAAATAEQLSEYHIKVQERL